MRRLIGKTAAVGSLSALTMVLALVGGGPASAADSHPPVGEQALGKAQPHFSGYRVQDIRDWSPEADPYAELMRAEIPLQERIEPDKRTQANPSLNSNAQIMLMQGDYGNSFFDSTMYNNDYTENTLNFWQYTDYWAPWHGAATVGTPQSLYDPETSDWRSRGFEFGILSIPNPAYTNAAHRNGVKSIAVIYFDPNFRPGLTFKEMLAKDGQGESTIANKLVQMAEYYGYDGYFLNQEEPGDDSGFKGLMSYLSAQGLWTQWYDTNSAFDANKSQWLRDKEHGRIHDSVFVNYDWPKYVNSSLSYAAEHGFDSYKEIFMGVEANQSQFSGDHISAAKLPKLYEDGTKNPRTSVALFTPSDFYQRGLDDDLNIDGYARPLMQTPGFQWMIQERERMYFSGVMEDPTDTGTKPGYARPDVGVDDASGWVGVADFTPARSVIKGKQFHSWFNTGHGMQYFKNGFVSADRQWANINIQSILPSWQWWNESSGPDLTVDFDYGQRLPRRDVSNNKIPSSFTPVGGFNGGSSLVVHGDLKAKNTLRLFKTDLTVTESTVVDVTFKKTSDDAAKMKLAVIFADNPDEVVEIGIPNSQDQGSWTTSRMALGEFAGKRVATLGLVFDGKVDGYQMNVGGIQYTSEESEAPERPAGLELNRVYGTGEAVATWDQEEFGDVVQYNLYAKAPGQPRTYVGGTYGDTFYIKNLFQGAKRVTLELRAVGKDGVEGPAARVSYDLKKLPSNLDVAEAMDRNGHFLQSASAGQIDVSWQQPQAGPQPETYRISVKLPWIEPGHDDAKTYTMKVPGTETSTAVPVPVSEGYVYDLAIQTIDKQGRLSDPILYRGRTHDAYAAPLPREDVHITGGRFSISAPTPSDWYKLTVRLDGEELFTATRGAGGVGADDPNETLQDLHKLPAQDGTLSVTLTDYAGNVSQPTQVIVLNGQPTDNDNKGSQ